MHIKRPVTPIELLERRRLFSIYYVATTGNDTTGTGSQASPFATIQHAANLTQPGDTVMVEPGDYGGFVLGWDYPQGGTAAAPITYQAEPGATIDSRDNKTADGIDLEPGDSYVNIYGFTVINGDGSITRSGIRVDGSDYNNILDNTCTGCGEWGIFTSFADYTLIQDNICSDSINQQGIYVSNSADHPTIIDNTCFGNALAGIHLNGDISQGGDGLVTFATIEDNVLYDNGADGASAINGDGLTSSVIENNLIYGNHSSGISLFQEDAAAGATNNLIANNTIIMASNARWAININSGSTGNVLFDNIIMNHDPSTGAIDITSDSLAGFESDYNVVTGEFALNDNPLTPAQWTADTGQDSHSIVALPSQLFANMATGDFHLKAGAAAIDAGVPTFDSLPAPSVDFDGNTRLNAVGWDAGAYQFDIGLEADDFDSSLSDLIVHGSILGPNTMALTLVSGDEVGVSVNNIDRGQYPLASLAQIDVYGGAGNDTITIDPDLGTVTMLDGPAFPVGNHAFTIEPTLAAADDSLLDASGGDSIAANNGVPGTISSGFGNDTTQVDPGLDIIPSNGVESILDA